MLKIKKNIFLGFCLLFVTFIYSQTDFENFQFRSIKEGISKRGVWSIVQDKKGYIWIGTNGAGLYKYDGINYVVYESDWNKPKSLNSNLIYTMYVGSQNELWIGTEEGLCLYDKEKDNFKTFDLKKVLNLNKTDMVTVRSLIEDNDKNLLIGTEEYGLLKLNRKTLEVTRIKPNVAIKGNLYISGLAKNKQGKIFVATNFGLKYFDPKRNIIPQLLFVNNDNSKSEITDSLESLFIEGNGNLWVGTTNKGLIKVVKRSIEYEKENFAITDKRIFSIVAIDNKNILCASENDGLFLINTSGKIVKKYLPNKFDKNGLKSNSIWSLMKDRDNRIWLGYYNKGVCIFDKLSGQFNSIESLLNNANSLQTSSVTSIAQDSSGKLWISMEGGGVDVFDPKNKKFIHINNHDNSFISGLNSNNVQEVFFDSKQNLWLGVWNEGIYFLKKGTKNFVNYSTKNTKGLSSDRILSFAEDSKGNVWIASFQWGLSYFDASKNSFFKCDSKPFQDYLLNTAFVRKVFVDSDDIVWVGTTKGLFTVTKKGDTFSVSSMKNKVSKALNSNNSVHTILSIFESKDKTIWVGTDGSGLFNYNKKSKKIKWYNGVKSLQEKSISAIVEDNFGSIWVSGRTGITKLDLKNNKFYNFNIEDGLLINDFNNNSVLKDNKGTIYFGNYEGINYFDPSQMSKSTKQPLLYFNDLKIFNNSVVPGGADSPLEKVISETKKIVLNHNQSIFTLEYIGINYSHPGKNEYAYYLEGFENNWNYVGNVRTATYTNLAPGDYVFKVKSAERGGSWSKKPLELQITILAPWWKTNFAYFIYLCMIALAVYYINVYYQNKFKAKQAINLERDKRIQIEKLNNKKLQFFTNISHEFRTPLTLIINPLEDLLKNNSYNLKQEVLDKLNVIHKSSDRLSRLINELMDFRKLQFNQVQLQVQEIEVISFTKDILSHFDEEAAFRKIELSFSSSLKILNDWIDPKMLEKIIFNILSNAFKVTPDYGSIKVRIKENNKLVYFPLINVDKEVKSYEIAIEDTGSGLDKKDLKKIFERFYQVNNLNKTYYGSTGIGLEVVKEFIELNKGKIEVDSVLGEGTTFKIIFPLGKEFFAADEFAKAAVKIKSNKANSFIPQEISESKNELTDDKMNSEKTHTILVVEDNSDLRSYLKEELKKEYKVIACENGQKGYDLAVQKLPDLILTDVIMPVMDGLEMCKKIKGNLKTSHIPLLMLSAKSQVKDRLDGIDSGADLYLSKPFDMEILKSSLVQLINSRQIIFNKFYNGITNKSQQKTTTIDNDFMQKILNYIHENISEPELSVELLASIVFLSRSQLYRKIKTLTGVSVNEFIRNVRLEKAKQLIELGNDNINEISYKVGFSSPSYFTKCFKLKFGHLPTEAEKS